MKKRLLTIIMSVALVASIVAPTVLVSADGNVDDNNKGSAELWITRSDGSKYDGSSGTIYNFVQDDGYIYFYTQVNITSEERVSGTEILEVNGINGSSLDGIESFEYSEKGGPWTNAENYIMNTSHAFTNKYGITRQFRVKIAGDVSFSLQYKVFTPVGVADYESYLRKIVIENGESSTWFVRPEIDLDNIQYDVQDFGGEGQEPYPTMEGKIFAGFYTDSTYSTPFLDDTGTAYAKFIDEDVLASRRQWKNDKTALRFVSTIDSLNYESVGFIFSGTYGTKEYTNRDAPVSKVFRSIYAGNGYIDPTVISEDSEYFFTFTLRKMSSTVSSSWTVTPYYVTLDGTKVLGETSTFSYTPQ